MVPMLKATRRVTLMSRSVSQRKNPTSAKLSGILSENLREKL